MLKTLMFILIFFITACGHEVQDTTPAHWANSVVGTSSVCPQGYEHIISTWGVCSCEGEQQGDVLSCVSQTIVTVED